MSTPMSLSMPQDPGLFGADTRPGLVGMMSSESPELERVRLFWIDGTVDEEEFEPFLWLTESELLEGLNTPRRQVPHRLEELQGPGPYRWLVRTTTMAQLKKISAHVAKKSGIAAGHPESPQIYFSDPHQQYLLLSGRCYFRELTFEQVLRLQLYVPNADGEGESALSEILLSDSSGRTAVLQSQDEEELLRQFVTTVQEWNPDVIEGHELFRQHLAHIYRRCKLLEVPFLLGRDGQKGSYRRSRIQIAERTLDYLRWMIPGRELVDTWIVAQLHDVSAREFVSTDLEDVAAALHLQDEPPLVQIARISRKLGYAYHMQAQIFPYPYEQVVLRGNATRINSLFLREYLRQRASLPLRHEQQAFSGGLTASEFSGIAREVYHCDVQSLYPSLILHHRLEPEGDHLHLFLQMLEKLKEFRLQAKEQARHDPSGFYQGLQATFKILINSFYGYLGFAQGQFADFAVAAEVTAKGRALLQYQMDWLKARDAKILEVDTDGIYFLAPDCNGEKLIEELNASLPEGLNVELEGHYPAMFCYKMKNYALLDQDGELIVRGSGLRSRSLEPFLRDALEEMIGKALRGQLDDDPLQSWRAAVGEGSLPIERLARTEVLSDPLWLYQKKTAGGARNRSAAYEVALASGRKLVPGDAVSYYVTGQKHSVTAYQNARPVHEFDPHARDENRAYYLKKLEEMEKKFLPPLRGEGAGA